MQTIADPRALDFLGWEFLTWLWYRTEAQGGVFELEKGDVSLVFNDFVALTESGGEGEQSILRKGSAHRSPEARLALRTGKTVTSARLEVAREDRTYTLTVDGETLHLRSVRYPKPQESDPADRELERLEALEEASDILDGLFSHFLQVRLDGAWDRDEVGQIASWIEASQR